MGRMFLTAIGVALTSSALADSNLTLVVGTRDETDSEDRIPAVGFSADFGKMQWRVRPEFGLAIGVDPFYGGNETEIFVGALGRWDYGVTRVHLGAGVAQISTDWGANSGTSGGPYLRGGASWPARQSRIGFDVRYLDGGSFTAFNAPVTVGYLQIAAMFQW